MTYRARATGRRIRSVDHRVRRYLRTYKRQRHAGVLASRKLPNSTAFFKGYQALGAQSGPGWSGRIGGACPVQGEGECDGVSWYFRARHTGWAIEFGSIQGDGDEREMGIVVFERAGTHGKLHEASWMSARHAWSLIKRSLAEFRRSRG